MIKERTFTYDVLYTITTEVESAVKSRPLVNIGDNIDDHDQPNHFRLGRRSNNTPVFNNKQCSLSIIVQFNSSHCGNVL